MTCVHRWAILFRSLDILSGLTGQDKSVRSVLGIAVNSTERIQRLVNSLLDINRLKSGQTIATQKAVDPRELIELAVKDAHPSAAGRNQKLETIFPSAFPMFGSTWI